MTTPRFLIVGGGLAGAIAAETLREEGFRRKDHLIGEEPHRPYERPPLSKDYLQGKADRESIFVSPQRAGRRPQRCALPANRREQ